MGRPSNYPREFQTEPVRLVLTTDKPMVEVARDLGINYKTLGQASNGEAEGVRRAREGHGPGQAQGYLEGSLAPMHKAVLPDVWGRTSWYRETSQSMRKRATR